MSSSNDLSGGGGVCRNVCDFFQKREFIDSVDPQRNTSAPPRPSSATEKVWKCVPISLTGISIRLILTFKSNNLDMIALNLELFKLSKLLFVVKQFCMLYLLFLEVVME